MQLVGGVNDTSLCLYAHANQLRGDKNFSIHKREFPNVWKEQMTFFVFAGFLFQSVSIKLNFAILSRQLQVEQKV